MTEADEPNERLLGTRMLFGGVAFLTAGVLVWFSSGVFMYENATWFTALILSAIVLLIIGAVLIMAGGIVLMSAPRPRVRSRDIRK